MENKRPVPMPRRNVIITTTTEQEVKLEAFKDPIKLTRTNANNDIKKYENVELVFIPNNHNDEMLDNNMQDESIINNNEQINIITNENKNINTINDQRPIPIPAPRKSNSNNPNNNNGKDQKNAHNYTNIEINKSTGAISKKQEFNRKAPEIPDGINNNKKIQRTTSTTTGCCSSETPKLQKSYSASTISSNSTDSNTSTENIPKFKTSTPGDILKSLGATSLLLKSSIGERVSAKSKSAKQKLDQNFYKFGNWRTEQTNTASLKIKNVRKRLHNIGPNNFSLGRDKNDKNKYDNIVLQNDRPQTLPPNHEMLKSITFNSPLHNKINNLSDLTTESSYEIPKSKKIVQTNKSMDDKCPSYDDCITDKNHSVTDSDSSLSISSASPSAASFKFERNGILTQSMFSSIGVDSKPNTNLAQRIKSESNLYENAILENKLFDVYKSNADEQSSQESIPCPQVPAPIFNPEQLYGKILPKNYASSTESESPVRPTRHRRRKERSPNYSNRATVGSHDFNLINQSSTSQHPRIFSRQVSNNWDSEIKIIAKSKLPIADRSDSWSFYDITGVDDGNSSPEPLYINSEPVYGKLYETDFKNNNECLTPEEVSLSDNQKGSNIIEHLTQPSTSRNLFKHNIISKDLLDEFDPLNMTNIDRNITEKSNKLILLENLLSKDTYGPSAIDDSLLSDDQSFSLSDGEDDNVNVYTPNIPTLPIPPERFDSLPTTSATNSKTKPTKNVESKSMIIHQNMSLRSDSIDNLVDEASIEPFLAQVNDVIVVPETIDLSHPEPSQTNWFIQDTDDRFQKNPKINPINRNVNRPVEKIVKSVPQLPKLKENHFGDLPPPSYFEAIECSQHQQTVKPNPRINPFNELKSFDEISTQPPPTQQQKNPSTMKSMFSNVLNRMEGINLNLKRKNSVKTVNKMDTRTIIDMIPKPLLSQRYVHNEGHLIKFPSGVVEDILKEHHARNAVLRDRKFQTFMDPQYKIPKEYFSLEFITTIQCVDNHKFSTSPDMHCFELTITIPKNQSSTQALSNPNKIMSLTNSANLKTQRICHVYGVAKRSERNIWMQKIIESMTDVFPQKYTSEYMRSGWCYMKSSITSQWSGAWILLTGRKLLFQSAADANLEIMDLRKARCIVLKESDETIKNLHVEKGPFLMIDCPPYTQYLIMNCPRETKVWRHIIKECAHNNGPSLRKQQLTKDNIPVIVDKCINFIYTHGSMSEGIYRKSGSENSIQKILTAFRTDAFSVQLTRSDYNEHDVANALKRFMRDLPEKLMEKYAISFISVSNLSSQIDKISSYKELLSRLPIYEYQTLRKLLGHLNFIQSQKLRNKMGVHNLSIIWGMTLMRKQKDDDVAFYEADSKVVGDLITFYKNLYQLTADEIEKEHIMLSVLQKYHAAAENLSDSVKQSGDLKVWIVVDPNPDNKLEEKQSFNVSLTPTKTVWDVCKELAHKMNREPHTITLDEVILDNELYRPLHYTENVLDTVLRWTYWPDNDRRNNYLKLSPTKILEQINRSIKNMGSVIPNAELKFADNKTKNMRPLTIELNDDIIIIMKKDKSITKLKEILLKDVLVYIGCEKKRELQDRWAITLIEKNFKKRTRDSPFIGHVMSGNNTNDKIIWYSHMMYNSYKTNILPNPEMIIP